VKVDLSIDKNINKILSQILFYYKKMPNKHQVKFFIIGTHDYFCYIKHEYLNDLVNDNNINWDLAPNAAYNDGYLMNKLDEKNIIDNNKHFQINRHLQNNKYDPYVASKLTKNESLLWKESKSLYDYSIGCIQNSLDIRESDSKNIEWDCGINQIMDYIPESNKQEYTKLFVEFNKSIKIN